MKSTHRLCNNVFLVTILTLFSFFSNAQTAVNFNGTDQYIDMTPWIPTGEYKIVVWLGDVTNGINNRTYLASDSYSKGYISFSNNSVQFHGDSGHPGIWNELNLSETRYLEIHIKDGEMKASDGIRSASVRSASITTDVNQYDTLFRRGNHFSEGSLLAIGFIDIKNLNNSRTIAFQEDGYPVTVSSDNLYVGVVNQDQSNLSNGQEIPSPRIAIVSDAKTLGDRIEEKYKNVGMPLTQLDESADFGKLYAWQGYYWFRTYINLYKATKDTKYIEWAIELADTMFFNTDDIRALRFGHIKNNYKTAPRYYLENREKFGPGWTQNEKHEGLTVLVDGMVLNGIMRLVDMIKTDSLDEFEDKADYYIARSKAIVDSHNSSWSETKQAAISGSWYYTVTEVVPEEHSGLYSNPLSYNHSFTMATAILLIDKWLGGIDSYRNKLDRLAEFFLDHVSFNSDGTCEWNYSWYSNQEGRSEDINHGHLDVGFFVLAEKEGYLDDRIPKCMAKTVSKRVAIGPGVIPNYVNGEGISPSGEMISLSYDYRDLAKFEPSIAQRSDNLLRLFVNLSWFREYAALSESFVK